MNKQWFLDRAKENGFKDLKKWEKENIITFDEFYKFFKRESIEQGKQRVKFHESMLTSINEWKGLTFVEAYQKRIKWEIEELKMPDSDSRWGDEVPVAEWKEEIKKKLKAEIPKKSVTTVSLMRAEEEVIERYYQRGKIKNVSMLVADSTLIIKEIVKTLQIFNHEEVLTMFGNTDRLPPKLNMEEIEYYISLIDKDNSKLKKLSNIQVFILLRILQTAMSNKNVKLLDELIVYNRNNFFND